MRSVLAALVLGLALLAPASAAGAAGSPPYITDDQGRVLILHGLNTAGSAKGLSGLPWITRDDVAREAQTIGTNSVRYLLQWKNIEPRPGVYDEAYLDAVAERVGWYRDQGMHVILDMHQDIYGPNGCGGNGAPTWAEDTGGQECVPQGQWELDYLEPAILHAFDSFWNYNGDHPELIRHYVAMFRHVAARFADDPAVLGYDLMNEPFGGTRELAFEGPTLTPFYQRLIDAIRQVDTRHWIFAEPASVPANQGLASSLGALHDTRGKVAFAPHLYPLALDLGGAYSGLTKLTVQAEMALWKQSMTATARRLGLPLWTGEYGAVSSGEYVDDATALFDQMITGWAYWSNEPGTIGPIAANLARPYPRAIAGNPTRVALTGRTLTVSWTTRPGAHGPTEVWFPWTPEVSFAGAWRWDAATHLLRAWGRAGTLTVTPA